MAFDKNKYISEYSKENYDELRIKVPKGKKDFLKKFAEDKGVSLTRYIIEAVEEYYCITIFPQN